MAPETDLAENELRRQLATLALSHVHPAGAMEAIAAASWWNMLARLGLRVPLVVVHDFGLLLSRNREGSRREVARSEHHAGAGALPRACWPGWPRRRSSRTWAPRRCATRRWR